ncbi:T9SS type A sorting domain-containing protein, partial [bacterium]|nr:T9SS type A sorting domain-containing protein [bacterium]
PNNITQWPPTSDVKCTRAFRDPLFGHLDATFGNEDHRYQPWEYIFDMSQDPTFSSGVINTIDPIAGMNTDDIFVTPAAISAQLQTENIDPSTLPEGIWYIRFRARDNRWAPDAQNPTGYAHIDSAALRIIEIDNTPPNPPGLIYPPDGDPFYFTSETTPVFVWSKMDGAAQFVVEYASDDQFTTFYANHCMTQDAGNSFTSESYLPTTSLPGNVPIFWRVKTIDQAGNVTFIPAGQPGIPFRKLYIDTVPPDGSSILPLTPEDNALINDYTPMMAWEWDHHVVDDPNDGIEMNLAIVDYHDDNHGWPDVTTVPSFGNGSFTVESSRTIPPWNPLLPHLGNLFSYESQITFAANETYYWRVRPIDQAGNIGSASTVWRFYLGRTSNSLPPPIIKKPVKDEVVTTKTIPLEILIFPPPLIPGQPVRTFRVNVYAVLHDIGEITTDDIKKLVGPIPVEPGKDTVKVTATLGDADGRYTLIATVVDDAGTESNPSNSIPTRIILDRESPKVDHLTITSDHEGTTSAPDEGISSRILVQVVFSEEMKLKDSSNKTVHPDIYIYPEKGLYSIKVEPYEIPKKSWGETGKVWNGIATIPVGKGYDGKASVSITGQMTDLAGKRISPNPTYYADHFVIDTAPLMKIKAFYNPTDERDIIISLESSEKLRTVPLVEVDFNGAVNQIRMNPVYEQIHTGVFTLPKDTTGVVSITAYAVDLIGNTGIEKYTFRVVDIDPNEGYNVTYPRDFNLKISKDTFASKTSMVIMPKKLNMSSQTDSESKIMAKVSGTYFPTSGAELTPIKENAYDVGPYSLDFKNPISIEFDVSDISRTNQIGILNYKGGKWHYVPSFKMGDVLVGAYKSSGIYAVMGDSQEPRIIDVTPSEGELLSTDVNLIEIEFEETGSGIDVDNVEVILDNVRMKVNVTGNKITYKPGTALKSGEHDLSVRLSDNFGNASPKVSHKFFAPKAFEVHDFYFYPNPSADTDPVIHYSLTQDSTDVYIKIYDISNQLVTTIDNLSVFAGENKSATWNRMNDELDYVANGVYYAKIIAKNGNGIASEKIFKVVVLK